MILSAIVALTENNVIGLNNQLPWHLPADLKHFKTLTTGHPIIMGRKTHESIGKPLPNRTNIIITRNETYEAPGCDVFLTLTDAIAFAAGIENEEAFIIGGAEIYKQCLPQVKRLYLTMVKTEIDGDAFFPELNENDWREVSAEHHEADDANQYAFSFLVLERIEK